MKFILQSVTKSPILPSHASPKRFIRNEIWPITSNLPSGKSQQLQSTKQMYSMELCLRLWSTKNSLWLIFTRRINYKLWLLSQRSSGSHDTSHSRRIIYGRIFQLETYAKALRQSKGTWIQNTWSSWHQSLCAMDRQFCKLLRRHGTEAYSETFNRQDR